MGYAIPTFQGVVGGTAGGGTSGACNTVNNIYCGGTPGDPGTGGGDTKDPSARVSIEGALNYAFDVVSAEKVFDGVYRVVTDVAFVNETLGGIQCAIEVTPEGPLQDIITALFTDYKVHDTVTFSSTDIHIHYDKDINELYMLDTGYSSVHSVAYDRLVIFNPTTRSTVYLSFETEDLKDAYGGIKGTNLMYDPINKVAYALLASTGGHQGTLIIDVIGRRVAFDTWNDTGAHGQTQWHYVLGINPLNDTCLIKGDSTIRWHNCIAGVPVMPAISTAATHPGFDQPGMQPRVDINNNYWLAKIPGGGTMYWTRAFLSTGVLTYEDINVSTDQIQNNAKPSDVNPNTNCFYYMSLNEDYLMKFDCTAKAASRVNASPYPVLSVPNRATTLRGATSIQWSADFTKLLVTRGGSIEQFFVVDPVDGTPVSSFEIPNIYSRNHNSGAAAVTAGRLWNVGSEVIQEIEFNGGEDVGLVSPTMVTWDAVWLSTTECQIEFRDSITGARKSTAFHIAFHSPGTPGGGGGTPGGGTGEQEHQHVLQFAFGDASPELIGQIAANKQILEVTLYITQAFNGTGPSLSIGPLAAPSDIMTAAENSPNTIGAYGVYSQKMYGVATDLYLHIVPGSGASAGTGIVVVEYQP